MCFVLYPDNIGNHSKSKSIIDSRRKICNYLIPGVLMYYKSPFKSAIIREKQKTAFLGEIRYANSEKR